MINVELLKDIKKSIQANPEQLDMDNWRCVDRCTTTMCIAGWGAALAGGTWLSSNPDNQAATFHLKPEAGDSPDDIDMVAVGSINRRGIHPEIRAKRKLGLTDEQAEWLFHCSDDDALGRLDVLIEEGLKQRREAGVG